MQALEIVTCPAHQGRQISAAWCDDCSYFLERQRLPRGRNKPDKQRIICNPPLAREVAQIMTKPKNSIKASDTPKPSRFLNRLLKRFVDIH